MEKLIKQRRKEVYVIKESFQKPEFKRELIAYLVQIHCTKKMKEEEKREDERSPSDE